MLFCERYHNDFGRSLLKWRIHRLYRAWLARSLQLYAQLR